MTTRTLYREFADFPSDIQHYMLERDLDPCDGSSQKLMGYLNISDDCFSEYLLFRKDLIRMCTGNKELERKVNDYLARVFTFPVEVDFIKIKRKIKKKKK